MGNSIDNARILELILMLGMLDLLLQTTPFVLLGPVMGTAAL